MEKYQVLFFEKENGKAPAKEFILSLDKKMRAKMLRTIILLADNGSELREPFSKPLSDGIFELRVKFGSNISRILYFFFVDRQIILTNGFIKKTAQTPKSEIDLAKKYRLEYLNKR